LKKEGKIENIWINSINAAASLESIVPENTRNFAFQIEFYRRR
jgi:hypothetical protein